MLPIRVKVEGQKGRPGIGCEVRLSEDGPLQLTAQQCSQGVYRLAAHAKIKWTAGFIKARYAQVGITDSASGAELKPGGDREPVTNQTGGVELIAGRFAGCRAGLAAKIDIPVDSITVIRVGRQAISIEVALLETEEYAGGIICGLLPTARACRWFRRCNPN